jgi:hypothetical protein
MFNPPMWKAFQRYKELDSEARKLFWRAATLLPLVAVWLRIRGFRPTNERLRRKLSRQRDEASRPGGSEAEAAVEKTCRMVKASAHYSLGRPTCLEQSLVLWYLLRSQKIPARIRIGVRKAAGTFEAHAWVEYEGARLNQSEELHQHYVAFEGELSDLPEEMV